MRTFHPRYPGIGNRNCRRHPGRCTLPGMSPHSHSGHGHHHTDIDWEVMATHLENSGELQLPALRGTAARLRELLGPEREVRRILDVGSGPGVMTCVLAEAFADAETV